MSLSVNEELIRNLNSLSKVTEKIRLSEKRMNELKTKLIALDIEYKKMVDDKTKLSLGVEELLKINIPGIYNKEIQVDTKNDRMMSNLLSVMFNGVSDIPASPVVNSRYSTSTSSPTSGNSAGGYARSPTSGISIRRNHNSKY